MKRIKTGTVIYMPILAINQKSPVRRDSGFPQWHSQTHTHMTSGHCDLENRPRKGKTETQKTYYVLTLLTFVQACIINKSSSCHLMNTLSVLAVLAAIGTTECKQILLLTALLRFRDWRAVFWGDVKRQVQEALCARRLCHLRYGTLFGQVKGVSWWMEPLGPQAPRVFGCGTSRGTPFTMIAPRLFPYSVILLASRTSI